MITPGAAARSPGAEVTVTGRPGQRPPIRTSSPVVRVATTDPRPARGRPPRPVLVARRRAERPSADCRRHGPAVPSSAVPASPAALRLSCRAARPRSRSAATVVLLSDDDGPTPIRRDRSSSTPSASRPTPTPPRSPPSTARSSPLSSLRGTPVVVNFFASTCVPCITGDAGPRGGPPGRRRPGRLPRPRHAGPARGRPRLVERTGVTYRTAQDKDGSVITALGGIVLPTTVLLDAEGTIVASHAGELDADELRELLADELGVERADRVIDAPLAIAFGAGMLATVNPCGFAMLPAYLGYFLGLEDARTRTRRPASPARLGGRPVGVGGLPRRVQRGRAGHLPPLGLGRPLDALGHDRHRRRPRRAGHRHAARVRAGRAAPQAGPGRPGAHGLVDVRVRDLLRHRVDLVRAAALHDRRGRHVPAREPGLQPGRVRRLLAGDDARAHRPHRQPRHGPAGHGPAAAQRPPLRHPGRRARCWWWPAATWRTTAGTRCRLRDGRGADSQAVDTVTGWSDGIARWVADVGPTRLGLLLALALAAVLTVTYAARSTSRR